MRANELVEQHRRSFGRIARFLAIMVAVSLLANLSIVGRNPSPTGKLSTDMNNPVNAAALKWFKADSIIAGMVEEASTKGFTLAADSPMFAQVEDDLGEQVMTVSLTGQRGSGEAMEAALITGYYRIRTGELALAHALYFETNNRIESAIFANGEITRDQATIDPVAGTVTSADGQVTEAESTRGGLAFGQAASAKSKYKCQKEECQLTYQFLQILTCGIIGLASGGGGALVCAMLTYWAPSYLCNRIYKDC